MSSRISSPSGVCRKSSIFCFSSSSSMPDNSISVMKYDNTRSSARKYVPLANIKYSHQRSAYVIVSGMDRDAMSMNGSGKEDEEEGVHAPDEIKPPEPISNWLMSHPCYLPSAVLIRRAWLRAIHR